MASRPRREASVGPRPNAAAAAAAVVQPRGRRASVGALAAAPSPTSIAANVERRSRLTPAELARENAEIFEMQRQSGLRLPDGFPMETFRNGIPELNAASRHPMGIDEALNEEALRQLPESFRRGAPVINSSVPPAPAHSMDDPGFSSGQVLSPSEVHARMNAEMNHRNTGMGINVPGSAGNARRNRSGMAALPPLPPGVPGPPGDAMEEGGYRRRRKHRKHTRRVRRRKSTRKNNKRK